MSRLRHTRRQALALGAAALAVAGVRPRSVLAAPAEPDLFELAVPDGGAVAAGVGWRTTDVLTAPRRFDLAGVRWGRGARVEVQLRARRRGGAWTRWVALPAAGDHGPDAGGAAAGTDPAWTGAADELQLRLRGHARGLRVRFVHAGPAARAAARRHRRSTTARTAARRRRGFRIPPSSTREAPAASAPERAAASPHRPPAVGSGRAAAATASARPAAKRRQAPQIIPRAAWGGDAVPPRSAPSYGQVQIAFVHHTVTATDYGPEDSAAMVVGITRYHRDTNGWNDVGYNFLVDRYGQIFEGRAGGVAQAIVGAQAQGWNSVSTGVACLGTFTSVAQTEAGMDALARLIGWKLTLHGVPVAGQVTATSAGGESNRYPAGRPVVFERISGHRDGNATSCPGDALYAQLADLRARAAGYTVPVGTSLSMRASTDTVRGEAPVLLGGSLRFADGGSAAGATVDVLFATAGSAFQRIAVAQCAPDGTWAATITVSQAGTVYARFPGDAARAAVDSPKTDVAVLPRLTARLAARRIRRGRSVRLRGTVTPAGLIRPLIVLERRERGRWRRVGSRRVPQSDGRFDTRIRLSRPGWHRITVAVPGATAVRTVRAT